MRQFISTLCAFIPALFTSPTFAVSLFCPELQGVYSCGVGKSRHRLTVLHESVNLDSRYVFIENGAPPQVLITDNRVRPVRNVWGRGSLAARCENGRLLVTFWMEDWGGHPYHVQDAISIERGALLTSRMSLPTSAVEENRAYVCSPLNTALPPESE